MTDPLHHIDQALTLLIRRVRADATPSDAADLRIKAVSWLLSARYDLLRAGAAPQEEPTNEI